MTDREHARLPQQFVWIVVLICALPTLCNWCRIDFATQGAEQHRGLSSAEDTTELLSYRRIRGALVHTVLEWTAFCVAVVTVVFAFIHFMIRRDAATPIIGAALFSSGIIDAFNVLAANGLVLQVVDYQDFVPFTWAISREFNICIMIVGAGLFIRRGGDEHTGGPRRGSRFILLVGVLFTLVAYIIIQTCAVVPKLPQSQFPQAVVPRPYDAIPLILYILAGGMIFPRFYRLHPSLFSHSLIVSVVPQVTTQLHAAFGSQALYDNHFNIAYFLKIVAYLVPLAGLIWEYTRTYREEVQLRAAAEKLQIARDIQFDLLPSGAPETPGFDLAGRSYPAEAVGGDYFDFIPMSDGCLGLVTADVSGHDIGASIFMTQTRAYLRALARTQADPAQIIQLLNRFLIEDGKDRRFVALFFAKLNPATRRLSYCPVGYMSYLIGKSNVWQKLENGSLPLGILEGEAVPAVEIPLEPEDLFLSFTDGVVEALSPDGTRFGLDRTLGTIVAHRDLPADQIVDALYRAIQNFCRDAPPSDDITLMVLKGTGSARKR